MREGYYWMIWGRDEGPAVQPPKQGSLRGRTGERFLLPWRGRTKTIVHSHCGVETFSTPGREKPPDRAGKERLLDREGKSFTGNRGDSKRKQIDSDSKQSSNSDTTEMGGRFSSAKPGFQVGLSRALPNTRKS